MADEEPQPSTPVTLKTKFEEDVVVGDEEEFYEKIEAPKFVDFTVPDPYCPDDRYWFCLRVGCDRKHEEEIDHEAISKDFVLRVMAARSPYMRLQKVLNRKPYSVKDQCPFTAPAKPSKSRISRLAMIAPMSKKTEPSKPFTVISSTTPQARTKQVAAKYLTTPRNRKQHSPNPNSFRSVQNLKPTTIAVPKNRMVAKALVFHSPKKKVVISIKTSAELRTPLSNICEGMKRLEIGSQKKRELRSSSKPTKQALLGDTSKRQPSASKEKIKAKQLVRPPNRKGQESKLTKERKPKKVGESEARKIVEDGSSDMEIDARSRDGSVLGCAVRKKVTFSVGEEVSNHLQENREDGREALQEITEAHLEKRESPEESRNLAVEGHKGEEATESDDKENVFVPETNRNADDPVDNSNHSERKMLGKQNMNRINKMVAGLSDRNLKQGLNLAAAGAHGVKFNKPKPTTNPKPFRLRTDERRILKEANLEKRMQSQLSQKETSTTAPVLPIRVLKRRQANEVHSEKPSRRAPEMASVKPTENSSRKIKQPLIHGGHSTKSKGVFSRKAVVSRLASGNKHVGVIRETLHGDPGLVTKVGASSGPRSLSRGKREATHLKEPHFHDVHVPKSCAMKAS